MSLELRCRICGGLIKGAVHVEPEGYYHPECFLSTQKAVRLAVLRNIEEYAYINLIKNFATIVELAKTAFANKVSELGMTDAEIAMAVLRGLLKAWRRSG